MDRAVDCGLTVPAVPHTLLVIDDEPTVHALLRMVLASQPYRLRFAEDGKKGLAILEKEKIDLVLLDLVMPKMDGRQVLQALRRRPGTQTLPVIVLTGESKMADKIAGFRQGADDYVTKPFQGRELVSRINRLLLRHEGDLAANPLTQLPGNLAIEAETNRRIHQGVPFAFHYLDVDHFKPYNDVYGYGAGDHILQKIAALLRECGVALDAKDLFIGHIGGDDFVLLSPLSRAEEIARWLAQHFDAYAPTCYKKSDRRRGFIMSHDRAGAEARFPIMTLSIAISGIEKNSVLHYRQLSDALVEIKHNLKFRADQHTSAYQLNRRHSAL